MRVISDLSLPGACDWLEVWCGRCFFRVIALAVWCCVSGRGGGGVVISCCCVVVSIEARWIKSHLAPWTPEAHAVINIANLAETNLNLASTHRLEMIMECVCLCVGWTGDRPAETMVCEHVWVEGRFWKEVDYAVCVCEWFFLAAVLSANAFGFPESFGCVLAGLCWVWREIWFWSVLDACVCVPGLVSM